MLLLRTQGFAYDSATAGSGIIFPFNCHIRPRGKGAVTPFLGMIYSEYIKQTKKILHFPKISTGFILFITSEILTDYLPSIF